MLDHIHIKNFAFMEEVDLDFCPTFNILTGETGAGKSLLIGSIQYALGGKIFSGMQSDGQEDISVELTFHVENPKVLEELKGLDLDVEEGELILARRKRKNRSICKINGESVPVSLLDRVGELLLEITGQHANQYLLKKEYHLEALDGYIGEEAEQTLEEIRHWYQIRQDILKWQEAQDMSPEERQRELSFLQYEEEEIVQGAVREGEEEELADEVKKSMAASEILQGLSEVQEVIFGGGGQGVAEQMESALTSLSYLQKYGKDCEELVGQLTEIDDLLRDFERDLHETVQEISVDPEELRQKEERLELVRKLSVRYGDTFEKMQEYLGQTREKIAFYEEYEEKAKEKEEEKTEAEEHLRRSSKHLSELRKKAAKKLEKEIMKALAELNFEHGEFEIQIDPKEHFGANGMDDVEFRISTNPGLKPGPLRKVASGGELSRIMLAIKTVFAKMQKTETLIFDEIDTGISGRTAQKVSEKMAILGKKHQVICITHLAQRRTLV